LTAWRNTTPNPKETYMQNHLTGGLALGQVHRTDLIKLLTPCRALKEDELLAILKNPTWWPLGVTQVETASRDATKALGITITVANASRMHPRFSQRSCPISLDLPYAIPLWLAAVLGGAMRLNGNHAITDSSYRSYIRFRLKHANFTLPSLVMDSQIGTQAITPYTNPHDCRWLSLRTEEGKRSHEPRKAFIESAGKLFKDHAPLGFPVTLEQYLEALTGWLAKADLRYAAHPATSRDLEMGRVADDRETAHTPATIAS
jgi:hypothetical protein